MSLDDLKQEHSRQDGPPGQGGSHLMRQKQQDLPSSVIVDGFAKCANIYDQHPNDYDRVEVVSIILLRVSAEAKPNELKQVETQAGES